jgi:hypothetical protein
MTPQGRLTLTAATPVMTAEAANQTTVYYTMYVGDVIPLYDGSAWANTTFTELSIAMAASANWAINSNYDLYVYNDGGTLRLVTGAAWTSDTARNESLTRLNGIWTNNASMTGRYGASSTVTVAANRGTYVGTLRTTGSTGTTTWELGGSAANGDPGFLYLWNCYNRVISQATVFDSTDSWTYATAAFRSMNASTSNRVTFVVGLAEDAVDASVTGYGLSSSGTVAGAIAIGVDSTTTFSGTSGGVPASMLVTTVPAAYRGVPGLGVHFLQVVEYASGATLTFYGDAAVTYWKSGFHVSGMF